MSGIHELIFFIIFIVFIGIVLALDLGVFNKKSHVVSLKEAVIWTSIWVFLSVLFYLFLLFFGNILHDPKSIEELQAIITKYRQPIDISGLSFKDAINFYNSQISLEYITGYLIEYALSIDNVFVMILIFLAFGIDKKYYHKILFWGILGAVIMRFIFIFISSALIQRFDWILYVFGVLLIFTGIKMFLDRNKHDKINTEKHPAVRFASKFFAIDPLYKGGKFRIKKGNKHFFTPLFLVLLVIEFTDVLFAVDSVPAIFSITEDPYIVFFSNIFAIIGLRSLFFVISSVLDKFHLLKVGLSFLLVFVGLKMLFHIYLTERGFTTVHSLIVIAIIIFGSIILSVIFPKKVIHNKGTTS
ncbi:MAG: TerC/Alx family metal homeostasis membrane protein [Hyphomicrobiales bacterium]